MDSNNRTAPVASTRVAGNASFVQLQICLVTMLSYFFCGASASTPILGICKNVSLGWHCISLRCHGASASTPILGNFAVYHIGTVQVFIPIENPHLTIVHFGKTLRVYAQPAINLGSMLKRQMRVRAMPE